MSREKRENQNKKLYDKKNNLSTRLNQWEEQGYILKERVTPKLGGKRYHYLLSAKAIEKLKTIKDLASELGD